VEERDVQEDPAVTGQGYLELIISGAGLAAILGVLGYVAKRHKPDK
jgi:hypothetical protein